MKTSEQLYKELIDAIGNYSDEWIFISEVEEVISEYKSALCREQKELCASNYQKYMDHGIGVITDSILNAPEPEQEGGAQ